MRLLKNSLFVSQGSLFSICDPLVEGVQSRDELLDVPDHRAPNGTEGLEPSRSLRMAPTRPMIQPTG